jgi:hypothetical protein
MGYVSSWAEHQDETRIQPHCVDLVALMASVTMVQRGVSCRAVFLLTNAMQLSPAPSRVDFSQTFRDINIRQESSPCATGFGDHVLVDWRQRSRNAKVDNRDIGSQLHRLVIIGHRGYGLVV